MALFLFAIILAIGSAAQAAPAVDWQTLQVPGIELRYHAGQDGAARDAASAASGAKRRIARELGIAAERTIVLILHPTHAGFARAVGTKRRQLIVGIASGQDAVAHVDTSGAVADMGQVVGHEVAHLLLSQAVGGAEVPHWFDEGYAEHACGSLEWAARERLAELMGTGRLFDLRQLRDTFPRDGDPAAIAYAQSHALVEHILRGAPAGALPDLVRRLRAGEGFEAALAAATAQASAGWDSEWRKDFQRRFRWYPWIAFGAGASGLLMALLCVLAYRAILRRKEELPNGDDDEEFYGLLRPRRRLRRR